jgi:hypothetical protein
MWWAEDGPVPVRHHQIIAICQSVGASLYRASALSTCVGSSPFEIRRTSAQSFFTFLQLLQQTEVSGHLGRHSEHIPRGRTVVEAGLDRDKESRGCPVKWATRGTICFRRKVLGILSYGGAVKIDRGISRKRGHFTPLRQGTPLFVAFMYNVNACYILLGDKQSAIHNVF